MAWTQVVLQSGLQADLYRQQFDQECGPSCVATVARMVTGRAADIAPARREVGKIDHNRPAGNIGMVHDWGRDWSYLTSLTQALSKYGVRTACTRNGLSALSYSRFCEGRTTKKPAILRVEWTDGSGHFVVTVGKNGTPAQTFIEILDPAYGHQRVPMGTFPAYAPIDSTTGVVAANGTLDRDWSVEV